MATYVKVNAVEFGEVLVDADDDGSGFTTIHLTPEQAAYLQNKREQHSAIQEAEQKAKQLADAKAERAQIKVVQLARIDARRRDLIKRGLMRPEETLEQYDTRALKEGLEPSFAK